MKFLSGRLVMIHFYISLVGVLLVLWGNCSQPYQVTTKKYKPTEQELNQSVSLMSKSEITNTREITFALDLAHAREILITEDPDQTAEWIPLSENFTYQLSEGDGAKTVYFKFRNFHKRETDWVVRRIVLDQTPPSPILSEVPQTVTKERVPHIKFEVSDKLSGVKKVLCRFNQEEFEPCTDAFIDRHELSDGPHSFEIKAFDEAGNESGLVAYSFTVDTEAPTISYRAKPSVYTRSSSAVFEFNVEDTGPGLDKVFCQHNGGEETTCSQRVELNDLSEGQHQFKVIAVDKGGLKTQLPFEWIVDRTDPDIQVEEKPPESTNQGELNFRFSATDDHLDNPSLKCTLVPEVGEPKTVPEEDCKLNETVGMEVLQGKQELVLSIKDMAGNESEARVAFFVDSVAPTITELVIPPGDSNQNSITFKFSLSDGSGTGLAEPNAFFCKADDEVETPCELEKTYTLEKLPEGKHTFEFRVLDKAGNSTLKTYVVNIDRTPPLLDNVDSFLLNVQDGIIKESDLGITWSVEDKGQAAVKKLKEIKVTLDDKLLEFICAKALPTVEKTDCSLEIEGLKEGRRELRIEARDQAGNSNYLEKKFRVDLAPPSISVTGPGPGTIFNKNELKFQISISDVASGIASLRARMDEQPQQIIECESECTVTFSNISDGLHQFYFDAEDEAGWSTVDTTNSVRRNLVVDTTAPVITISGPPDGTYAPAGQLELNFAATDERIDKVKCQVNAGPAFDCGNSYASTFSDGDYEFTVSAWDTAGNLGTKVKNFSVDGAPPQIRFLDYPHNYITSTNATFVVDVVDLKSGVLWTSCFLSGVERTPCTGRQSFTLREGSNSIVFKASDRSGLIREESREVVVDLVPPDKPTWQGSPQRFLQQNSDEPVYFKFRSRDRSLNPANKASGIQSFTCTLNRDPVPVEDCAVETENDNSAVGYLRVIPSQYDEDEYEIRVFSTDKAGKKSEVLSHKFEIN